MDPLTGQPASDILNVYLIPWGIKIVIAIAIFIIGRWIARAVTKTAGRVMGKSGVDETLSDFLCKIIYALLLIAVIIAALEQLGVNTTSAIAIFAAAGLAIGMALKDTLSNFSAGVMLILFKPFQNGDFIEAGGVTGVVEKISVFSTIMRTGDNKEIIVPNSGIYGGTITNYSAKETRRVDMVFGIGYDDNIKQAKQLIEQILNADERVLKDPAPTIAVGELADSSVNINVRPWVKSADYWGVYADTLENVKEIFDANGISIPYPQMDVHNPAVQTETPEKAA